MRERVRVRGEREGVEQERVKVRERVRVRRWGKEVEKRGRGKIENKFSYGELQTALIPLHVAHDHRSTICTCMG